MIRTTVIMPVFNAGKTVEAAILSIKKQSLADWHLIIVDDGSSDDSVAIARRHEGSQVTVLADGKRKGISARLNEAVRLVGTEYVCRMDADDISFSNRLARQTEFLDQHRDVDLCASQMIIFSSPATPIGMVLPPAKTWHAPWRGAVFPHPTWFGRADWFRANPYRSAQDGAEDQGTLFRGSRQSTYAVINAPLLGYREDGRTFPKLFGRRIKFWQVMSEELLADRRWKDLLLLWLAQPAKIAGDFVHDRMPWTGMRNRLHPLNPVARQLWDREWQAGGYSGPENP